LSVNVTVVEGADRTDQAEYVSTHLLLHSTLLVRLLAKEITARITRTEAGVLRSLSEAPRRITELAEIEGLAQPTTTLLVKRLEDQGLVRRERPAGDRRVVVVSVTPAGTAELEEYRTLAFAALRRCLEVMPDDELTRLTAATRALGELISTLLGPSARLV
jgi:DNA-binding MarR family transcriptional regulator